MPTANRKKNISVCCPICSSHASIRAVFASGRLSSVIAQTHIPRLVSHGSCPRARIERPYPSFTRYCARPAKSNRTKKLAIISENALKTTAIRFPDFAREISFWDFVAVHSKRTIFKPVHNRIWGRYDAKGFSFVSTCDADCLFHDCRASRGRPRIRLRYRPDLRQHHIWWTAAEQDPESTGRQHVQSRIHRQFRQPGR